MMDTGIARMLVALFLGVGLSAACGFRIFVPLLVVSIAARAEYIELASGWDWVGSIPAIVTFASATVLEIVAYYIPWLDNLLDSIAAPAAVIAGIVVTTAVIGDMNPYLKWPLAVIAGGGSAGLMQAGTTILRAASTATTGGNPASCNCVASPSPSAGSVNNSGAPSPAGRFAARTRLRQKPMSKMTNGRPIMCGCRSANRKLKNGNSVMVFS